MSLTDLVKKGAIVLALGLNACQTVSTPQVNTSSDYSQGGESRQEKCKRILGVASYGGNLIFHKNRQTGSDPEHPRAGGTAIPVGDFCYSSLDATFAGYVEGLNKNRIKYFWQDGKLLRYGENSPMVTEETLARADLNRDGIVTTEELVALEGILFEKSIIYAEDGQKAWIQQFPNVIIVK